MKAFAKVGEKHVKKSSTNILRLGKMKRQGVFCAPKVFARCIRKKTLAICQKIANSVNVLKNC